MREVVFTDSQYTEAIERLRAAVEELEQSSDERDHRTARQLAGLAEDFEQRRESGIAVPFLRLVA